MTTTVFCLITAIFITSTIPAAAQNAVKVPRIGYISGTGTSADQGPYVEALRQGLRDLGYVEGKNIVLEYRYAERKLDRSPSLAAELVQLKVDIIFVPFLPGIRAAKTGAAQH